MHIEKKSDKCKIKRAKAIIQVKETIMQKVKDKIIPHNINSNNGC